MKRLSFYKAGRPWGYISICIIVQLAFSIKFVNFETKYRDGNCSFRILVPCWPLLLTEHCGHSKPPIETEERVSCVALCAVVEHCYGSEQPMPHTQWIVDNRNITLLSARDSLVISLACLCVLLLSLRCTLPLRSSLRASSPLLEVG